MSHPVVCFVPGAWHSPDGFDKVITLLSARGFSSRKINLLSVGRSPAISSLKPDVEVIRSTVLAEMQQEHDVVVVCHSYGGAPTSEALKGLDKPQTAAGGRVCAIVYIAAYLCFEGVSLAAANEGHGGNYSQEVLELMDDGNIFFKKGTNPGESFYNDLSPEEAGYWVSRLKPHASSTFTTPGDYAAWKDIPSWYLISKQDKALRPEIQRAFVKEAQEYLDEVGGPGTGQKRFRSEEIDASHSPFLSHPGKTADFIETACISHLD